MRHMAIKWKEILLREIMARVPPPVHGYKPTFRKWLIKASAEFTDSSRRGLYRGTACIAIATATGIPNSEVLTLAVCIKLLSAGGNTLRVGLSQQSGTDESRLISLALAEQLDDLMDLLIDLSDP